MRKLLLSALMAIALVGCQKEEPYTPPPATTGKVRFTNVSSNPYTMYLDNVSKGNVNANSHVDITTSPGAHNVKAVQVSGYLVYPTEKTASVTVPAGGDVEFIFP